MRKGTTDRDVDEFFEVLADPTRRKILQLLGERPHRAGELAKATAMSAPAMSRHLRLLLDAGLIEDERVADDARARVFKLRLEPLAAAQAWLDQIQAHWKEQLTSFKKHVEKHVERKAKK